LDSTSLLYLLPSAGWACDALFVDYGHPARDAEKVAAARTAAGAGTPLKVVAVGGLAPGPGEIVGRNMLLVSLAIAASAGRHDAVAIGIHAGAPYWDCSPAFAELMQRAFDHQANGAVRLLTPFLDMNKLEIATYATQAGVPVHETWSCETSSDRPCGKCQSCDDRAAIRSGIGA
jgi:7-cyano-7-deazaguanine synthase